MLSIATDYQADTGDPSPSLRAIAETGFTHIHWCHHWNTDFLYAESEIDRIEAWLGEYGLELLDLHGSAGSEKNWFSEREYERLAGVELVRNRIEMTARLGGASVVMHAPNGPPADPVRRSLDALEPIARERGVRIAIENGDFDGIAALLDLYAPDYLGLCCDVGHANMVNGGGIAALAALKHRLIAIHVHDNDGVGDLHNLPFSGTINWQRLAGVLAASAYTGPINMEVGIRNSGFEEETVFLAEAFERGTRLEAMRRGGEN